MPRPFRRSLLGAVLLATPGCQDWIGLRDLPPSVYLTAPVDGQAFVQGDPLVFQAEVADETPLPDLGYAWSSDRDGALQGETEFSAEGVFFAPVLSLGAHTVTLTVTDENESEASDTVSLEIVRDDAPSIVFESPTLGSTFELGTSVLLRAQVSDDSALDTLVVDWSGPARDAGRAEWPAVPAADGLVEAYLTALPAGEWTLSVAVTDARGRPASAAIGFEVLGRDADGDGFIAEADGGDDCDDGDTAIFPGATEVCNGADDDCDGAVDIGAVDAPRWYADVDEDRFGDPLTAVAACDAPPRHVADAGDCDDASGAVHPEASEVCNGLDDDCDGTVDADAADRVAWYLDADTDGFGAFGAAPLLSCATIVPGHATTATDCDDARAATNPGGEEACNGRDDDCDGLVDDADLDTPPADRTSRFADADGDSHGDPAVRFQSCIAPPATAASNDDCDDTRGLVHPGGVERCNGLDDDCDGKTDDEDVTSLPIDRVAWYADFDSDDFGDATDMVLACEVPADYVGDATDCDDTDLTVFPGAGEVCNGVDDDCDGLVDADASDRVAWYRDADADGFGASTADAVLTCASTLSGHADNASDCDDARPLVNPDGVEVCNGYDDDCDAATDDADADTPPADADAWYADIDRDGHGDPATGVDRCIAPPRTVLASDDCDDARPTVKPGGIEACNGRDDDCDGAVDDADVSPPPVDRIAWYLDFDGDDFGDATESVLACLAPADHVADATDCEDADGDVYPGAPEVCNGYDDNCDPSDDDGCPACKDGVDNDGDGRTDFPADPGCASAEDSTETNPAVACDDGVDNEADGRVDFRSSGGDPGCISLVDGHEQGLVDVALGLEHACALLDDGRVKCWGRNDWGQLGLDLPTTTVIGDGADEMGAKLPFVNLGFGRLAASLAVGINHTCAILVGGDVKCWGKNDVGQLGLGDTLTRGAATSDNNGNGAVDGDLGLLPSVPSLGGVASAAATSGTSTCVRLSDGQVRCWGQNNLGQLGVGNTIDRRKSSVATLTSVNFGSGRTAKAISGNASAAFCALLSDDSVGCWGANWLGGLGINTTGFRGSDASHLGTGFLTVNLGSGVSVDRVSMGWEHACARLTTGELKCWGRNGEAQLGLGLPVTTATATNCGTTACVGGNAGDVGPSLPSVALGASFVVASVEAGKSNTCALSAAGQVKCWGQSHFGLLGPSLSGYIGDLPGEMGDTLPAVNFGAGRYARRVALSHGGAFACAILDDDTLKCWGSNQHGVIGQGTAAVDATAAYGDSASEWGDGMPRVWLW